MLPQTLYQFLTQVQSGALPIDEALEQLRELPFSNLGYATVDHHRSLRQGTPEVIYGEGKTAEQIIGIARSILTHNDRCLITRISSEKALELAQAIPETKYASIARCATIQKSSTITNKSDKFVAVIAAGTSDLPVAEEACETLSIVGINFVRVYDVGVAGIHRLLMRRDEFIKADVLLVVAGMEGALPSVVGGLTDRPVIAVPTSVGYGAAFQGVTALCGMLTSCASGLTVVNIDNGFGAAFAAARILNTSSTFNHTPG